MELLRQRIIKKNRGKVAVFNAGNQKIMAVNNGKINLFFDILPSETKKAFDFLSKQSWLDGNNWYLAGGTALALQANHRKSYDLDFFTAKRNFDNEELLNNFSKVLSWEISINKKNTIYGKLYNAKASFIAYPFFVPKQDFIKYGTVDILNKRDIGVMKIVAISQRGRKRDFFDLYWCAKNIDSLENLVKSLKEQYPAVAHDYHHILKSLVYFDDAESDPDLELNFSASWPQVKEYFETAVPIITESILGL